MGEPGKKDDGLTQSWLPQTLLCVEIPGPVDFQVAQQTGFGTDGNIKKPVKSYRRYIDGHLPAMQVTGYEGGQRLKLHGFGIKIPIGSNFPFG